MAATIPMFAVSSSIGSIGKRTASCQRAVFPGWKPSEYMRQDWVRDKVGTKDIPPWSRKVPTQLRMERKEGHGEVASWVCHQERGDNREYMCDNQFYHLVLGVEEGDRKGYFVSEEKYGKFNTPKHRREVGSKLQNIAAEPTSPARGAQTYSILKPEYNACRGRHPKNAKDWFILSSNELRSPEQLGIANCFSPLYGPAYTPSAYDDDGAEFQNSPMLNCNEQVFASVDTPRQVSSEDQSVVHAVGTPGQESFLPPVDTPGQVTGQDQSLGQVAPSWATSPDWAAAFHNRPCFLGTPNSDEIVVEVLSDSEHSGDPPVYVDLISDSDDDDAVIVSPGPPPPRRYPSRWRNRVDPYEPDKSPKRKRRGSRA